MEYSKYQQALPQLQADLVEQYKKEIEAKAKK